MRHVLKRNRGAMAVPAAMALALMACEGDDNDDASPGIEEGEQDEQDEQALLPAGAFGEQCQQLLVAADADGVDAETDVEADDGVDDDAGMEGDDAFDDDAGDADADEDATGEGDTTAGEDEGDEFAVALTATETDAGTDTEDDVEGEGVEPDDGVDGDADTDADAGADVDAGAQDALRQMTVMEALEALPDVERFTRELAATPATELDGEGDVTVFAPLDEAFEDEADGADAATTDEDAGVTGGAGTVIDERVIAYHLHPQAALSAQQLVDDESVSTAAEDAGDLRVTVDGAVLSVDADESRAQVVCANIETQDGTIHVIDELLLPRETDTGTETDTEGDLDTGTDNGADAGGDLDAETDAEAEDGTDADDDLDPEADGEGADGQ